MAKSVLKEICIMLLLCVAIILILGILFYDYIPTNRVVPSKEAYETPEEVEEELNESISNITVYATYEITDSDLNLYKSTSSYVAGKSDPFSLEDTSDDTENTEDNTANSTSSDNSSSSSSSANSSQTNTSTSSSTSTNSTNTYYSDDTK